MTPPENPDPAILELPLTQANRLRLAQAFRFHKRVDLTIPCVVEGQMGQAFADDSDNPTAFKIAAGPFTYLAGEVVSPGGRAMVRSLPAGTFLMPSPPEWTTAVQAAFPNRLRSIPRYRFSSETLTSAHLEGLLAQSRYRDRVEPMDLAIVQALSQDPDGIADFSAFDSAEDFLQRGLGCVVRDQGQVAGLIYSSLACSFGIEISLFVMPSHRNRGLATALSCVLLLRCLALGLAPNWDAGNEDSCRLAQKLGYTFVEEYEAFFLKP
jgi:GNAT superfamily N-acetyltransferase